MRKVCYGIGACVVALLSAAPAFAQQPPAPRPERPFRGLFGGGPRSTRHSLIVNGALGVAAVQRIGPVQFGPDGEALDPEAVFGYASAGLNYGLAMGRLSIGGSLNTSVDITGEEAFPRLAAGVSAGLGITQNLEARAGFGVAPASAQSAFQALGNNGMGQIPGGVANALIGSSTYVLGTQASLSYSKPLTRRITLGLSSGYFRTDVTEGETRSESVNLGASLGYAITRHLQLSVGYTFVQGHFEVDGVETSSRSDGLSVGLNYGQGVTFRLAKRTTFTANGGLGTVTDEAGNFQLGVNGTASLNHEIGRSWSTHLTYNRSFGFAGTFADPVTSDGVQTGLSGLISRRVQFSASAGYTRGKVGFNLDDADNRFEQSFAGSALQFGLTRFTAISVDYTYSRSDVGTGVVLLPGVVSQSEVQVFRVGLSVTAPIIGGGRNASR